MSKCQFCPEVVKRRVVMTSRWGERVMVCPACASEIVAVRGIAGDFDEFQQMMGSPVTAQALRRVLNTEYETRAHFEVSESGRSSAHVTFTVTCWRGGRSKQVRFWARTDLKIREMEYDAIGEYFTEVADFTALPEFRNFM